MPDSDRFYRGFRGKHWGKAAKCIIDGKDFLSIAQIVHLASATVIKTELSPAFIKQVFQYLQIAILDERSSIGRNSEIRIRLDRELHLLSRSYEVDFQSFLLIKDAAVAAFSAFSRSGDPCHAQAILDGLSDRFHERIIRGRLFSVMRERALTDPQYKLNPHLEKALLASVIEMARPWFSNIATGCNKSCRLPSVRRKKEGDINSLESLHKPLSDV